MLERRALKHSRDEEITSNHYNSSDYGRSREDYKKSRRSNNRGDDHPKDLKSNSRDEPSQSFNPNRSQPIVSSTIGAVVQEPLSRSYDQGSDFAENHENGDWVGRFPQGQQDQGHNNHHNQQHFQSPSVFPSSNLQQKKAIIESTNKKPEVLNRNKRIFSSLMGHLGLAKSNLEKDNEKIQKQKELLESMTKKNDEESLKVHLTQEKEKKKRFYEIKIDAIRDNSAIYTSYISSLQHALFTSTEPKISWLPVNHNKVTKEMLVKRHEEVLREIAEREIEDNKKIRELEEAYQEELKSIEERILNQKNSTGDAKHSSPSYDSEHSPIGDFPKE